ncbi:hypothetical protein KDK77_07115 [bacterium]|nr:hypothetical protein [bacterium]
MMRRVLFLSIFIFSVTADSWCTALDQAAIVSSPPHDEIRVSVLPVHSVAGEDSKAAIVTETIIHSLSAVTWLKVIPLTVSIQTAQVYYPDYMAVIPDDLTYAPGNIEVYGQLGIEEKQTLSVSLTAHYIVDGVFIQEESASRILIDVFSKRDNTVTASFAEVIESGGSVYETSQKLGLRLEDFFFQQYAGDMVLDVLNTVNARRISFDQAAEQFDAWRQRYTLHPLVSAGVMVVAAEGDDSTDTVINAGEQWFESAVYMSDQQVRFFQSVNVNPFLILGKAYMRRGDYVGAHRVLSRGAVTFPFNTPELSDAYAACMRESGKDVQPQAAEDEKK